jgi:hypothetical protein
MAGVLPYLATSLSTVYLAFDINHASATGSYFLFSQQTAEQLLHIIEPLQVGYGAVVSLWTLRLGFEQYADRRRFFHSWALFTGDWNGLNTEAYTVIHDMPTELLPLR